MVGKRDDTVVEAVSLSTCIVGVHARWKVLESAKWNYASMVLYVR
jgi:hypothetical protein